MKGNLAVVKWKKKIQSNKWKSQEPNIPGAKLLQMNSFSLISAVFILDKCFLEAETTLFAFVGLIMVVTA